MGCSASSSASKDESASSSSSSQPASSAASSTFTDLAQSNSDGKKAGKENGTTLPSKYGATSGGGGGGTASSSSSSPHRSSVGPSTLIAPLHNDIVFAMAPGPSSSSSSSSSPSFFSGSEDHSLTWFNSSSQLFKLPSAHTRSVTDLIFSPMTSILFTASRDRNVKSWYVDTMKKEIRQGHTFQGHTLPVSCVAVDAYSSSATSPLEAAASSSTSSSVSLVSGGRDYQLRLWDVSTGLCISWTDIQQNVITDVTWLPSSETILQTSEDLTLRLWDLRNKQVVQEFSVNNTYMTERMDGPYFALHCDVSSDGNYFLTGHNGFEGVGCEMKLFDRRMGRKIVEVQVGRQAVTDACFIKTNDGGVGGGLRAVTSNKDASVCVWDLDAILSSDVALSDTFNEVGLLAQLQLEQNESVQSLACHVSSSGSTKTTTTIATGHVNGRISIWEVDLATKGFNLKLLAPGTTQ